MVRHGWNEFSGIEREIIEIQLYNNGGWLTGKGVTRIRMSTFYYP